MDRPTNDCARKVGSVKRCRACGGTYQQTDGEGFTYFHVCPPLSAPELVALVAGLDTATAETFTNVERPGHRDENVSINGNGDVVLISEGAGADDVADTKPAPSRLRTVADVQAFVKSRSAGGILPLGTL